jgi:EAL domain-containing protein (putative c-di-GMP-specific phosphodiesterase class I)
VIAESRSAQMNSYLGNCFLVPGVSDRIHDLLARHQLPASTLELEITEGALEQWGINRDKG